MDVVDSAGDKVGSVAHIHRYALAAPAADDLDAPPQEDVVEVRSGLLGLGAHYYVPAGAVREVSERCVFLAVGRDDLAARGWDARPAHLAKLP
jgi:hypothetical protein